ncbi:MAG TPA: hypothetical protein VEX62_13540 [Candidatus Limnocylindrales bacterium]|nr:hypothetical protein [Candidatus Limnocylindrales bacterium]
MTEPINVTPGGPPPRDEFSQTFYAERGQEPEWAGWTWTSRGRGFPWLGVLLVLVGVALLFQYLVPAISITTLLLLAIAIALLAGWLFAKSWLSMVFGMLTLAIGLSELIEDLALLGPAGEDVNGLWSAMLAIAFLIIWAIGQATKRRSMWPLWGAAIFGLIGFVQLSSRVINMPELGALWPLLIIVVGVVLLLGARSRAT